MTEPRLIHLNEPMLTFGYSQKTVDPRDGLTLFGPFSQNILSGKLNVGIIGPTQQRIYIIEYLEKIHKPIYNFEQDVARPYFPGLESVFNIYIDLKNLIEIDVSDLEINKYLKYQDGHQRVFRLSELYAQKLIKYTNEEDLPVTIWIVVIPDAIYLYGRPLSSIPFSKDNIPDTLRKKDRDSDVKFLFHEENELKKAYEFEINFHNQLKAKLLEDKIITQIILESTIAYNQIWDNIDKIVKEEKFDTSKAWNIATSLYYKAGGIPWKLGDIRENVCYLGLVFKKLDANGSNHNACCAAQMFLDSGDGMVFKGNIGPWFNPRSKEFHLSYTDSRDLLQKSLDAFKEKSNNNQFPSEVFIHAKTYFNDDEWAGFIDSAKNKSKIIGIRIRDDSSFKLYRDYTYSVPRGTVFILDNSSAYLWSKGFIPRIQTQLGLETPNPLSVEIIKGDSSIETVCRDILALTKLNYNSCIYGDGLPVTLKFADSIGDVLTAGKDIKTGVLPFKHYI